MISLAKLEEALGPGDEPLFLGQDGEWVDLGSKLALGTIVASVCCAQLEIDTVAYSACVGVYRTYGPHPKESLDGYLLTDGYDLVEELHLTREQVEHAENHQFEQRALIAFYALLSAYLDCFFGLCVDFGETLSKEEHLHWVRYFANLLSPLSKEDCQCGELARKKLSEVQDVAGHLGLVV